jgi:hypothetical protein
LRGHFVALSSWWGSEMTCLTREDYYDMDEMARRSSFLWSQNGLSKGKLSLFGVPYSACEQGFTRD